MQAQKPCKNVSFEALEAVQKLIKIIFKKGQLDSQEHSGDVYIHRNASVSERRCDEAAESESGHYTERKCEQRVRPR